ncbi:transposase [Microbispora sp. H10885]|uniref:transposase n=1 Tax=Microbispora sp. H10885 TaxID=2729110 RepID=UPI0037C68BA2
MCPNGTAPGRRSTSASPAGRRTAPRRAGGFGTLGDAAGPRPVPGRSDDQSPPGRRRPRLPLALVLTPGNVHDATMFEAVTDAVRIPRVGKGRPRTRPDRALGDKAYPSRAIRAWCRRHGIAATTPERRDQQADRLRRGSKGGRPPVFDAQAYRHRNVMERCFNRLKQFRAVATRFDKLATRYRAGLELASLILWLRQPAS